MSAWGCYSEARQATGNFMLTRGAVPGVEGASGSLPGLEVFSAVAVRVWKACVCWRCVSACASSAQKGGALRLQTLHAHPAWVCQGQKPLSRHKLGTLRLRPASSREGGGAGLKPPVMCSSCADLAAGGIVTPRPERPHSPGPSPSRPSPQWPSPQWPSPQWPSLQWPSPQWPSPLCPGVNGMNG